LLFSFRLSGSQADGENDSGSLGSLLNDVSKAVNMSTGFRFVWHSSIMFSFKHISSGIVLAASSIASASSSAASMLQLAPSSEAASARITPAPSAPYGDTGGLKAVALSSEALGSSAANASIGTIQNRFCVFIMCIDALQCNAI
jgi:hypothetical protein